MYRLPDHNESYRTYTIIKKSSIIKIATHLLTPKEECFIKATTEHSLRPHYTSYLQSTHRERGEEKIMIPDYVMC